MDRVEEILSKVLSILVILLMGSMSVLVIFCVILRYVFSISFVWTEELITFLFLATTYFGLVLGIRYDDHIKIEFLTGKYGKLGKKISDITIGFIVIFVQVIVFKASLTWINRVGNVLSPGMRIPNKIIYSMLPISCILVVFYELLKIRGVVLDMFNTRLSNKKGA